MTMGRHRSRSRKTWRNSDELQNRLLSQSNITLLRPHTFYSATHN